MRNCDDRINWTYACAKCDYCRPCSNIITGCRHDFKRNYFAELDNPSVSAVERQPVYCSFNQAFSVIRQGYGKLYRQEHPRLLIGVRKADGHVGDSARHTVRQPRGRYDVATRSPDKEHLDWRSIAYRAQADYYRFVGHIDRSLVPIPDGILLAYGKLYSHGYPGDSC